MSLERDATLLPIHLRRDRAVHKATTTQSKVGRIAVGLVAAALLLGSCGGDDGEVGSGEDSNATVNSSSNDASSNPSTQGAAPAPEGPSGGFQLDDRWPEKVWIPADVTVTGGTFDVLGNDTYLATLLSATDIDLDDLSDALVRGNGTPDTQGDHASGAYVLSYYDLLPGNAVSFSLVDDPPATGLIVNIAPN